MLVIDKFECRRYPPTVVTAAEIYSKTFWPLVSPNDWCGEWNHDEDSR
jgi:hypothetical protein